MSRIVSSFLFAVSLFGAGASLATCINLSPEKTYSRSVVVFSGVVESVDHAPAIADPRRGRRLTEYVIRVGQVWKGPLTPTIVVYSKLDYSDNYCKLDVGSNYLLYAQESYWDRDVLLVGDCQRAQLLHRALEDRVFLGEARIVDPDIALAPPTESELKDKLVRGKRWVAKKAERALARLRENRVRGASGQ
jgi:hypothetical protein